MLFKRIISEGLAHYSYIFGSKLTAVVIDPRRDIDIYLKLALEHELQIKYILETHRHEDFLTGSIELARRTGAEIFHADAELDYQYGSAIQEGQVWHLDDYELEALFTPGHTPGAYSFLLKESSKIPWLLFTGDTIMAGGLGRTDLTAANRTEEMTAMLYNSLHDKILSLPEGVIICPAHGSGSVCGADISEREWTTVGLEKRANPKLQYKTKSEFIQNNAKILERPPYFRKMEVLNLSKNISPVNDRLIPLSVDEVAKLSQNNGYQILDVRSNLEFSAAHIKNSIHIWEEGLAEFAGWFLSYDQKIILVSEPSKIQKVQTLLSRLGFDDIMGYLAGGLLSWHKSGRSSETVKADNVQELCKKLDQTENTAMLLDIRSLSEVSAEGELRNSLNIPLTQLLDEKDKIPVNKEIYIFCGTGLRSMVAASILNQVGLSNNSVILGGLSAWNSSRYPLCSNKR